MNPAAVTAFLCALAVAVPSQMSSALDRVPDQPAPLPARTWAARTINAVDFGAAGDGTTDDTAALQAALADAGGDGATVVVPPGTYRITQPLEVPGGTALIGPGEIVQGSLATPGLRIMGSDVTIDGLTLLSGRAGQEYADGAYAVEAQGEPGQWLYRIVLRHLTVRNWGDYGVYLRQVRHFRVSGCDLTEIGYTGIGVLSGSRGVIRDNRVDSISPGAAGNAYGIIMSYSGKETESTDIVVRGNRVSGVFWEGIDAHGGSRLTIDGNTVSNSGDGIALARGDTAAHVGSDNRVTNNLVEDSSRRAIVVVGQVATPRSATTIAGNTFRRTAQAVLAFNTRRLRIARNTIVGSRGYDVFLERGNSKYRVSRNRFVDFGRRATLRPVLASREAGNRPGIIAGNYRVRSIH